MNSLFGRNYFEVLEQKQAALLADKKAHAALQVARLLHAQTPHDSVKHGAAARGIAAGHNALGQHLDAWRWARVARRIHNDQLQLSHGALHVLGERAVSGAYAGAMGVLVVLSQERDTEEVGSQALKYARVALEDFEKYRMGNGDNSHLLEAVSMSRISVTESILGNIEEGRRLAHMTFDRVEVAEGRFGGEARDMNQERLGAYGAIIVATTADLLRVGDNLYDTVREIV